MVSIDPGVHASGIALWDGTELVGVEYKKPFHLLNTKLIIEKPQVYQGRAQKGNPNDLIDLAIEVGRISSLANYGCEMVLPRAWKGTVKKEIMLKRILSKLTTDELRLIRNLGLSKSSEHNVVDSIGVGLWKLGRL